jgi:signal transduction histidine kinase
MLSVVGANIKRMDADNRLNKEMIARTNNVINEIVQRMRGISFDLMPNTLQAKGLESAITAFSNSISRNNALKIRFVAPKENIALDKQTTIHIYRIVQEIIHNTVKHAKATIMTIVLTNESEYLALSTNDNGIGFDYQQQLKESRGLGLKSMMNRIYLLQAEFSIDSEPGKGTSITIKIPQRHA